MINPSEPNSERFLFLCHVFAMYQCCSISASFEWFRFPKRMVVYLFYLWARKLKLISFYQISTSLGQTRQIWNLYIRVSPILTFRKVSPLNLSNGSISWKNDTYEILKWSLEAAQSLLSFDWYRTSNSYAWIPPLWTAEFYYFIVTLTSITIAFIKTFWELTQELQQRIGYDIQ